MSIEAINSVIDIGTQALDCTRVGDFNTDPYMGGLGLVGPDNRIIASGEPFVEPSAEFLMGAHAGGIGNAANAVAEVLKATSINGGQTWAVMAWLGEDAVGEIWKSKIDPSIDTSLLLSHPTIRRSGLADIRVQASEYATAKVPSGERAIYFRAGASGATEFSYDWMMTVSGRDPFNVNISYPGLFPDGADRSDGRDLMRFVRAAQRQGCPCVSMDTHGFTKLSHIRPALSAVDMFNTNFADAVRVFLGIATNEYMADDTRNRMYNRMSEEIRTKYIAPESGFTDRDRMFTITDRSGTFLMFIDNRRRKINTEYLPSPCASIPAINKTSAGDVRFGLQRLYIALNANSDWMSGQFTWEQARTAVNIGQIGTTLHLQGSDAHALQGVSMHDLEKVAISGNQFPDLSSLNKALAS